MKKIYYLFAILSILSTSSCKKFLDGPQPQDSLAPGTYFETAAELNLALNSVYDILQSGELYKTKMHYLKGLEADDGFAWPSNFTGFLNSNQYTAATGDVFAYWRDLYKGITRANILLDNVDKNTEIPEEVRSQIRGEATFLRGYYYFMLVQSYGGVPLVIKPVSSILESDLAKSTEAEVYAQVLKDMTEAEGLVAEITKLGFGGRVSKSAVRGILARVCLTMAGYPLKDISKYKEAKKWAQMVKDDAEAGHRLNPSYSNVFIKVARDEYDIKESIWEVEFSGNGSGDYGSEGGNIGYNSGASQPAVFGLGVSYVWTTGRLNRIYEPGDVRKGWNIQNFVYLYVDNSKFFKYPISFQYELYHNSHAKWRREYELVPWGPNLNPQNFAILRYSDVLLMLAEAENEDAGATQIAKEAVNEVRRRAFAIGGIKKLNITNGGSGYTSNPVVTITGGGGTGASATATILGGVVVSITLTQNTVTDFNYGTYTSAPVVTIAPPPAGGTPATATASLYTNADADVSPTITQVQLREFIRDERSRELCFEALRKYDLIRWGIYVERMHEIADQAELDGVASSPYVPHIIGWYRQVEEKHVLLPIPGRELITNKLLVQNPGWN